jgi:CRP-like cAMP-binding protein
MEYPVLLKSPLFSGMSLEEISNVVNATPHRLRNYQSGALISLSGDQVNNFMLVLEGVVKGEMVDFTGRVIKIEDIYAPGALASAFIFGNRNRFPVNVIAVSNAKILIIEKSEFLTFLRKNDRILLNFLDIISNRSQFLSEKIKFLNFKTIKGKLAQYILHKAGNDKNEFVLDRTQNDLADFFGVARPSIARVIGELEEKGLLLIKGKRVKILDKKGLSELASE